MDGWLRSVPAPAHVTLGPRSSVVLSSPVYRHHSIHPFTYSLSHCSFIYFHSLVLFLYFFFEFSARIELCAGWIEWLGSRGFELGCMGCMGQPDELNSTTHCWLRCHLFESVDIRGGLQRLFSRVHLPLRSHCALRSSAIVPPFVFQMGKSLRFCLPPF